MSEGTKTRTIVEDVVARMSGSEEKVLPEGTTIRFEIGDTRLSCMATDEGLKIYKISFRGEGRIMTVGVSSNVLIVK